MADGTNTTTAAGLVKAAMGGGIGQGGISTSDHLAPTATGGVFSVDNSNGGGLVASMRHWPWYAWAGAVLLGMLYLKRKG